MKNKKKEKKNFNTKKHTKELLKNKTNNILLI